MSEPLPKCHQIDSDATLLHRPLNVTSIFFFPEPHSKSNHTQCQLGSKNNVTVYKVRSSLRVDPSDTVRIIAVEKQRTAEVEVQAWKTVEGNVTTGDAQFLLS